MGNHCFGLFQPGEPVKWNTFIERKNILTPLANGNVNKVRNVLSKDNLKSGIRYHVLFKNRTNHTVNQKNNLYL